MQRMLHYCIISIIQQSNRYENAKKEMKMIKKG